MMPALQGSILNDEQPDRCKEQINGNKNQQINGKKKCELVWFRGDRRHNLGLDVFVHTQEESVSLIKWELLL